MENTEKPLFEIDLGPEAGVLRPRSFDELDQWLTTERAFWAWTGPVGNTVPNVSNQLANQNELHHWVGQGRNFEQQNDQAGRTRVLEQIQGVLRDNYLQKRILHSRSPRAKYLESIADKNLAGWMWRVFCGHGYANPGDPREMRAVFLALAFDAGLTDGSAKYDAASTQALQAQISSEHENLRREAGKLSDEFRASSANIANLHEEQRTQYGQMTATRETEFRELISRMTDDLENVRTTSLGELQNIKDTYDKKMSLQAAVTYLKGKAKAHLILTLIMGPVSIVAGSVFIWAAVKFGAVLLVGDKPAWHHVAVAVLAATLCFWLLRILVRIFLSNLHLATDSRNRATLMQTYLALLREGDALKTDDRELILKMLFRPFSDGVVRDDGTPPGIWDFITRTTAGR